MNFYELIKTDPESAKAAVFARLQAAAFDYLDNYELEEPVSEESIDEAVVKGTVKKDKVGNVLSFKTVPDKKSNVVPGSVKKDKDGNVLSFKTEEVEDLDSNQ